MSEEAEVRNQSERLRARFKTTGLVNPAEQVWEPTPTAGDYARAVTPDLLANRETEIPAADQRSQALWKTTRARKENR